jgi:thiol:disulfide interchange protein DsbC
MKKLIALFAAVLLSPSLHAGESEIRQSLQSKFPNIGKIEHVVKTPYSGLYEVIIGDQLLYIDAEGEYLFDGQVVELKNRRNITEERRRILFAVEFDKLPLKLAMKKVKGDGSRKLAYFTDPNCGYCKKLEQELKSIDNVTLYLFMYPIFDGSAEKVQSVLCSKDPVKAWDRLMQDNVQPKPATCKLPTAEVMALGRKLKVNGTPALIFANGVVNPGYMPADRLEQALNANK